MNYFQNAGAIIVEAIFGFLVFLFVGRVLLQLVRANFHNPVCQFFYRMTNPVLMPLRKVLRPVRGFDVASASIAYLLECLKVLLLFALARSLPGVPGLLVLGVAELLYFVLGFYIAAILVQVILSYVSHDAYHPVFPLLRQVTEPLLAPVRRRMPLLGGFDLSPMVVTVLLAVAIALVADPLRDFGVRL